MTTNALGLHLVLAREGETWTVYDASGTIIRDGVTAARLPEVVGALVSAPAPNPTADKAQLAALGAGLQRGDQGR